MESFLCAGTATGWKRPQFDWENLVGVKLFSWIAGAALLLAAVFFLRYSISQGWLMPPVRMTIGIIVGVGLLILCELKAARKYPVTANAMDASAIAILFSTFFAARVRWDLIIPVAAFGLMVLVTAVAVLLSIRRDSIFIALLGLVGGFATPALLSTGENRPMDSFWRAFVDPVRSFRLRHLCRRMRHLPYASRAGFAEVRFISSHGGEMSRS